ncbi:MAG: class I SAM-dependent methyltransferase [Candidatus Bathyarchaeia archaeon]
MVIFLKNQHRRKITLDIGCGFSAKSKIGEKYIAKPRGDVNIDTGKPELKIHNFVRASAEKLPFREGVFDEVYMIHVIEHLNNPLNALKEIFKVLKKNGKLILVTPNIYSKSSYTDPTHKWHFDARSLKECFKASGFFISIKVRGEGGCWIPIKGNTRLWGKFLGKIHFLAKDLVVTCRK